MDSDKKVMKRTFVGKQYDEEINLPLAQFDETKIMKDPLEKHRINQDEDITVMNVSKIL